MREGMGSVFLYNMIIIFIVVTFAFLAGTMSYAKAFRINSRILNSIEIYEGYNDEAANDIAHILNNYGYKIGTEKCPSKKGTVDITKINTNGEYSYCIYATVVDERHYNYGVLTYMYLDLPIIGQYLKFPVYTKSDTIYYFTTDNKKVGEFFK